MDVYDADITLSHHAKIAKLEQRTDDHEKRICAVEKKLDGIYRLQLATLVTIVASIIAGVIVNHLKF